MERNNENSDKEARKGKGEKLFLSSNLHLYTDKQ